MSEWHNNWTIEKKFLLGGNFWLLEHRHIYKGRNVPDTYQILSMLVEGGDLHAKHECHYCREQIEPVEILKLILLNRP